MTYRMLLLFFTLSTLLSCSLAEQGEEQHHRQKRGLVKMMMHVMWDPVRLIRYWYAYDVTKEIAKSWRKIIPTMVLHPYLGDTPGVAKYLHPTYGLARTHKKQTGQFKYPDGHTDDDYIQSLVEQSESSQMTYGNPGVSNDGYLYSPLEQSEPSKHHEMSYGDRLPQVALESASSSVDSTPVMYRPNFNAGHHFEHFPESSFAVGHGGMESHKDAHHVYLRPVVHHESKRDNRERLPERQSLGSDSGLKFVAMPFPYHIGIPSSGGEQHIVLRGVLPAFGSSAEVAGDHAASSNIDSARTKNVHSETLPHHFVSSHPGFVKIQQAAAPVSLQAGHQEIHIVFHPIPVREDDQHHGSGGQSVHFVPYNFNVNESSVTKVGHFSFDLPQEPASSHEEHGSPSLHPQTTKVVGNESHSENKTALTSAEVYDAKQTSRVTWVLKKKDRSSNSPKFVDTDVDDSIDKQSSVNAKGVSDHAPQHPLRLKGHRIDIDQLREDLKHGTPVLIPFDKTVKLPPNFGKHSSFTRNFLDGGHLNIRGEIQYDDFPQGSIPAEDSITEDTTEAPHYSNEEYIDNNSTQRLLLFLAKKHSSQHRR